MYLKRVPLLFYATVSLELGNVQTAVFMFHFRQCSVSNCHLTVTA